jgi:hypothetical protein
MVKLLGVIVAVFCLAVPFGKAAETVVITVGDGLEKKFTAGQIAILPIYASNTFEFDLDLQTFSIGFDISTIPNGYDGASLPGSGTYFDFSSATFQSSLFNQGPSVQLRSPTGRNYDVLVSASRSASYNFVPGETIKLGDLSFNISSSTPSGTFGFKFQPNANLNGTLENIFNPTTFTSNELSAGSGDFNNMFEVEAIPEPTTITLLAIGLAGGVACRRFRKRSSSVGPGTTDPSTNGAKV